jgi:hypothetical protein
VVEDAHDWEVEDIARRRECKELEAIDLTGCVSAVFVNALTDFVNTHMLPLISESDSSEDEDGLSHRRNRLSRHRFSEEPVAFPGLQRLSLRGAKSIPPHILSPFVTAFPSLTHLDLSSTRASPDILDALATSPTVRLQSLSLARCVRLTGSSIRNFLVSAPAARYITELNLYGDTIFPNPMSAEELRDVFTMAPCFTSGKLVYLDISSASLDQGLLDAMPTQAELRSLGLSFIPGLPLNMIAEFIRNKAAQVEIITLLGTSPELVRVQPRQASLALHSQIIRPLCTPPFKNDLTGDCPASLPPTHLRVIELATSLFPALGAGACQWRVVRSKGGRGWYVDTASGWVSGSGGAVLRRDLEKDHPWRRALQMLADANGNVSSGIGWHARKMEVRNLSTIYLFLLLGGGCPADFMTYTGFARPWFAWTGGWTIRSGLFRLSGISGRPCEQCEISNTKLDLVVMVTKIVALLAVQFVVLTLTKLLYNKIKMALFFLFTFNQHCGALAL